MGFAGVSVATLGIGFQANAEKTWDFETDPFDEFPYIASSQEDYVWGGQGWDDWGAEGNPGGFFSISEQLEALGPLPFYLTLMTVLSLKPST